MAIIGNLTLVATNMPFYIAQAAKQLHASCYMHPCASLFVWSKVSQPSVKKRYKLYSCIPKKTAVSISGVTVKSPYYLVLYFPFSYLKLAV